MFDRVCHPRRCVLYCIDDFVLDTNSLQFALTDSALVLTSTTVPFDVDSFCSRAGSSRTGSLPASSLAIRVEAVAIAAGVLFESDVLLAVLTIAFDGCGG